MTRTGPSPRVFVFCFVRQKMLLRIPPWLTLHLLPPTGYPPHGWQGRSAFTLTKRTCSHPGQTACRPQTDRHSTQAGTPTPDQGIPSCSWPLLSSLQTGSPLVVLHCGLDADNCPCSHFFAFSALGHNSAEYLHLLIEAVRLSFADAVNYVADPSKVQVPVQEMLSKDYAAKRRALITDK